VNAPDGDRIPEVGFEDRMATVEFRVAATAHITVDGDSCRGCTTKACTTVCPSGALTYAYPRAPDSARRVSE